MPVNALTTSNSVPFKPMYMLMTQSRLRSVFCFTLLLSSFISFGNPSDTSKRYKLAVTAKEKAAGHIIKEANIVFPDILIGNEEESIEYIEKFAAERRSYINRMYQKGAKFFPKITKVLDRFGLPDELKVLIALESAFNGNAVSKAGAVGYWQFMDEVAREYGLKIAPKKAIEKKKAVKGTLAKNTSRKKTPVVKDDRKNFAKSTFAAARYLKDRSRNLDEDWLLIVASYNCGVGNVWNAMQRSGVKSPDFWDIKNYLPAETRAYVMNFISLNVLFHNYSKYKSNTLTFRPTKINLKDLEPGDEDEAMN